MSISTQLTLISHYLHQDRHLRAPLCQRGLTNRRKGGVQFTKREQRSDRQKEREFDSSVWKWLGIFLPMTTKQGIVIDQEPWPNATLHHHLMDKAFKTRKGTRNESKNESKKREEKMRAQTRRREHRRADVDLERNDCHCPEQNTITYQSRICRLGYCCWCRS